MANWRRREHFDDSIAVGMKETKHPGSKQSRSIKAAASDNKKKLQKQARKKQAKAAIIVRHKKKKRRENR